MNILYIFATIFALGVGILLFSFVGILIGLVGFWASDVWATRFLFYVLLEFFTGMLFPLDILPSPVGDVLQRLPFAYFIFVPLKIYLGQWGIGTIISTLLVGFLWLIVLWWIVHVLWTKGLRLYTAVGR